MCFSCLYPGSPLQNRPQLRVLALQGSVSLATFCNATFAEPQGVIPALQVGTICRMLHLDKDQVAFGRDPGKGQRGRYPVLSGGSVFLEITSKK